MPDNIHEQSTSQILYHYTSLQTLVEIIKNVHHFPAAENNTTSRTTWPLYGTSIMYLNDTKELFLGLEIAKQCVESYKAYKDEQQKEAYLEAIYAIENKYKCNDFKNLPFVTSFSENRDSYPMWASYNKTGQGVAIGVKSTSINAFVKPTKNERERSVARLISSLSKCVYNRKLMEDTFLFQLNRSVTLEKSYAIRYGKWSSLFEYHLNTFGFKDPSYAFEKEHRLVHKRNPEITSTNKVKYTLKNDVILPYIEHRLDVNAIHEIILGPSPADSTLQLGALKQWMIDAHFPSNGNGDLAINVSQSNFPFRP